MEGLGLLVRHEALGHLLRLHPVAWNLLGLRVHGLLAHWQGLGVGLHGLHLVGQGMGLHLDLDLGLGLLGCEGVRLGLLDLLDCLAGLGRYLLLRFDLVLQFAFALVYLWL